MLCTKQLFTCSFSLISECIANLVENTIILELTITMNFKCTFGGRLSVCFLADEHIGDIKSWVPTRKQMAQNV